MPNTLSIFATKPAAFTLSRHFHEFRHVHAIQTIDASMVAPILSYKQGFVPFAEAFVIQQLNGSSIQQLLPLPRLNEANREIPSMTGFAQLQFPSVDAINGVFKSVEYQTTSGAHHFADPQVVYITEELESLADQDKALGHQGNSTHARAGLARARLLVALAPASDATFKAKWDDHATRVKAAITEFAQSVGQLPLAYLPTVEYQRHLTVNMTQTALDAVLDGSQFRSATFRQTNGGYEEFSFLHSELLIAFLNKYGKQLGLSYKDFAKVGSSSNTSDFRSFAIVCDEAQFVDPDAVSKAVRNLGVAQSTSA